jgi:Mu transposase, C-terminal domain
VARPTSRGPGADLPVRSWTGTVTTHLRIRTLTWQISPRSSVNRSRVADLAELNGLLAAADAADDARCIAARAETIGQAAARELPLLRALPRAPFDVAAALSCRVDSKARICVRQSYYSVPVRLAGRRVAVRLGARSIEVLDGSRVVATHVRSLHKGTEDLVLDHYLEVLARKPGALPGATALAQARAQGAFTAVHQRYWDTARRQLGDGAGTRALIEVLLLHRSLPAEAVLAGMHTALSVERIDANLVTVEARRHLEPAGAQPALRAAADAVLDGLGAVAPMRERGEVPRPVPTLADYDDLLVTGGTR